MVAESWSGVTAQGYRRPPAGQVADHGHQLGRARTAWSGRRRRRAPRRGPGRRPAPGRSPSRPGSSPSPGRPAAARAVSNPSSRGITTSSVITSGLPAVDDARAPPGRRRPMHLEALELEVDRDQVADQLGVVDDEHPSRSSGPARGVTLTSSRVRLGPVSPRTVGPTRSSCTLSAHHEPP